MPKYPHVYVPLAGQDGNAFAILGRVQKALRRAKISEFEVKDYMVEAMSGDYDHLLTVTLAWVSEGSGD